MAAEHAPRAHGAERRQQFQAVRDEGWRGGRHRRSVGPVPSLRAAAARTMRAMTLPFSLPLEPPRDKAQLRRQLQAERLAMVDRHQRAMHLQEVLRVWLVQRDDIAHRRLLADQGRVRCAAGAVPLDRGEADAGSAASGCR